MKNRIKPSKLNNDRGTCKHGVFTKGSCSTRNYPMYRDAKPNRTPINKDNSIWGYHCVGVPCGWVIRVPSIKKSKRVWINFYRLYPRMLEIVNAHKNEAVNGIVTITERFGSNHRDKYHYASEGRRTIKFRVIENL